MKNREELIKAERGTYERTSDKGGRKGGKEGKQEAQI